MKKLYLSLLVCSFMVHFNQGEAAVIKLQTPGVTYVDRQPIPTVVVDNNGNSTQQTFYYNTAVGGIDFSPTAGQTLSSVYFPSLQTGYIWNNGYWVDRDGYYWEGNRRVYLNNPNWHSHWGTYWGGHPHAGWDYGYHGSSLHYHGGDHHYHGGDHHYDHHGRHDHHNHHDNHDHHDHHGHH